MPKCITCREPWDSDTLNHELPFEECESTAPDSVKAERDTVITAMDEYEQKNPYPGQQNRERYRAWQLGSPNACDLVGYPTPTAKAVMTGKGCPACNWNAGKRKSSLDEFKHNLFDSGFDGDPADLINEMM